MSPKRRVLVVDDDPWSQQLVCSQLAEAGFHVDRGADGWEAMILAGRVRPDLVLIEVHLPSTDAWTVAEQLRTVLAMGEVPFIFTAEKSPGLKPGRSFRPGKDQLLAKPLSLQQLHEAVRRALGGAAISEIPVVAARPAAIPKVPNRSWETRSREPALRGSLAAFGLSSLLMVVELERMSGLATLHSPFGTGRLSLRQGRVIRASIEAREPASGADAIYEMLQWAEGTFELEASEVKGEDQIQRSTSYLLMEGARLADERVAAGKNS